MADFYPIHAIGLTWIGLFVFCFLGLTSKKFRMATMGQARQKVWT